LDEEEQQLVISKGGHPRPFERGTFRIEWGEIGGTHCPTDGFCMTGHFVSPTQAVGEVYNSFACKVTGSFEFTAQPR